MDPKPLIDSVAPTPFGWVITTQNDFDLSSMIAFRSQLISLARAFGTGASNSAPDTATVGEETSVPVPLRAA